MNNANELLLVKLNVNIESLRDTLKTGAENGISGEVLRGIADVLGSLENLSKYLENEINK